MWRISAGSRAGRMVVERREDGRGVRGMVRLGRVITLCFFFHVKHHVNTPVKQSCHSLLPIIPQIVSLLVKGCISFSQM